MRWHSQNLNDGPFDTQGPMWLHGRGWLTLVGNERDDLVHGAVEWGFGRFSRSAHMGMDVLGEGFDVKFDIGLPFLFSFYLMFSFLPRAWRKKLAQKYKRVGDSVYGHGQGLVVFDLHYDYGALRFSFLTWSWMDSHDEPKRSWSFYVADRLFGDFDVKTEVLKVYKDVNIPTPEGNYGATITFEKIVRKRPRSPFSHAFINAHIDLDELIDGDKGLRGMSTPARSLAEAVGIVVQAVIKDRGHTEPYARGKGRGVQIMQQAIKAAEKTS